jgi:hypothetical protein
MPPRRWSPFPRYVSAAERRERAEAAAVRLGKTRAGAEPVRLTGKTITRTFWGTAWCENLQAYADLAHRLERGRSYVRNGAVVDLKIEAGRLDARVVGTRLYRVTVAIEPIAGKPWQALVRTCTGQIASLVALLRGELPDQVMEAVTDRAAGLFPRPREMQMSCDCPDAAGLCKHLAATLYGVGVRLDDQPELLFRLRGVNAQDLVERATLELASGARKGAAGGVTLDGGAAELGALFGIELVDEPPDAPPARTPKARRAPTRKRRQ